MFHIISLEYSYAYIFSRIALENAKPRDLELKRAGQFLCKKLTTIHFSKKHSYLSIRQNRINVVVGHGVCLSSCFKVVAREWSLARTASESHVRAV